MGDFTHLVRLLQKTPLEEIRAEKFFEEYCEEAWTLTACFACNGLVGASAPLAEGRWTSAERRMVAAFAGQSKFDRPRPGRQALSGARRKRAEGQESQLCGGRSWSLPPS